MLAQRDALTQAARAETGARITRALLHQAEVKQAQCVLVYLSFGSEFDTAALLQALQQRGARLALPRIERERRALALYAVNDLTRDLVPGTWGIREPHPERCERLEPEHVDLVLAPGVAFTARCDRLGYGGGYYDRLLGGWRQRPAVIAAAFEAQIVDVLPMGPQDIPVDRVVTEDRVLSRAT